MIQFQDVSVQYNGHPVLHGIDLDIQGGEFVTIIGPSGAGKSTLLHTLIGKISPSEGQVHVDGHRIDTLSRSLLQEYRRHIGMIFQDYKLLPRKTVYENVAFPLEACGWSDSDIRERSYEVLKSVGLIDHVDRFPHQLSGGEVERTAIARALVHEPKLLIADEPTGNLDPDRALEIIAIFKALNAMGITVILASHNRDIVNVIQGRVVHLQDGMVLSDRMNSGYDPDQGEVEFTLLDG